MLTHCLGMTCANTEQRSETLNGSASGRPWGGGVGGLLLRLHRRFPEWEERRIQTPTLPHLRNRNTQAQGAGRGDGSRSGAHT